MGLDHILALIIAACLIVILALMLAGHDFRSPRRTQDERARGDR